MTTIMKKESVISAVIDSVSGSNLKKSEASKIHNAVLECMFDALKRGETVRLPGIGTLSVTNRKETTYRNPQTRELVTKAEHKRIKFSMSKNIKDKIN